MFLAWPAFLGKWLGTEVDESTLGQQGEALAARFLRRRGYKILARGTRLGIGELDLIARDGATVVFVEVKTRQSQQAGHPVEAVDPNKQRRLTRLAVTFLKKHRLLDTPARFDIVAITWPEGKRRPTIDHFVDAFEATGLDGFYS
jgi:putative endonuclease